MNEALEETIKREVCRAYCAGYEEWERHEVAAGRLLCGSNDKEHFQNVTRLQTAGYGRKGENGDYLPSIEPFSFMPIPADKNTIIDFKPVTR